ncbi:hypothetical protein [Massilia sp. DD77]|uniref:hypothetical protein n=1 Tax=Massilia sp. DD77 TaxID=3109349 RepID=UPI002FFF3C3B
MKKYAPYLLIALFALLLWDMLDAGMHLNIDGEEFDGPFGALLGMMLAGGGALLGLLVTLVVGVVLAVVFAGVGVILLGALGLGAVSLAVLVSPLLLPLLLPLALVWYLVSRSRKARLSKPVAPAAA